MSSLKRYRQFYCLSQKGATLSHQLTWSHYSELLVLNNTSVMNYYIMLSEKQNLSVRQLRQKIKSKEYERLDDKTKIKLINDEKKEVIDFIKIPPFNKCIISKIVKNSCPKIYTNTNFCKKILVFFFFFDIIINVER